MGSRARVPEEEAFSTEALKCSVFRSCAPVLSSMGIDDEVLDSKYHKCYCDKCCRARGERKGIYYTRGTPPTMYALPFGWCRFALRLSQDELDKFRTWNVSFHGTHKDSVRGIVRDRRLRVPDNKSIFIRDGHLPDQFYYFTTPSVVYASFGLYAEPFEHDGQLWQVLVQLLQRPGSFEKGFETSGLGMIHLDPGFPNHEVEWKSNVDGAAVVYAVLVRPIPNREPEGLVYPHGTFFRIRNYSWYQPFDGSPPFFPSSQLFNNTSSGQGGSSSSGSSSRGAGAAARGGQLTQQLIRVSEDVMGSHQAPHPHPHHSAAVPASPVPSAPSAPQLGSGSLSNAQNGRPTLPHHSYVVSGHHHHQPAPSSHPPPHVPPLWPHVAGQPPPLYYYPPPAAAAAAGGGGAPSLPHMSMPANVVTVPPGSTVWIMHTGR